MCRTPPTGAYEEDPARPWPEGAPRPKRGYSEDLRPDLKQLIDGLTVHGPTRIPLNRSVLDGNTADPKANRFQIESLAALLPAEHEVTLVADCTFVDAETLGQARNSGFHYVSLLPHTFGLRYDLVEKVRGGTWSYSESFMTVSFRQTADPGNANKIFGFRLARSDP